uniref:Pre-mRNA polyadenylation factor Fip1 domain-containing protein n=1 Tax=Rhizophora mucronata TaxID=61149 RepID=A0A2P2LM00_RHIMU
MEDEDEFGDLYTDVLGPFSSSITAAPEQSPALSRSIDLNLKGSDRDNGGGDEDLDDKILYGASRSSHAALPSDQTLANSAPNSIHTDKDSGRGTRVLVSLDAKLQDKDLNSRDLAGFQSSNEDKEIKFDIEEGNIIEDSGPAIPGLSGKDAGTDGGDLGGGGGGKRDEDWEDDSDSEDDLQIVLNDKNHGSMGMERGVTCGGNEEADDDDEDGEPLVILADGSTTQAMGEQNWAVGEDGAAAVGAEGERKEGAEMAGKGIATVAPKIGYSNHAYPHPFHSQFKYVRPGAAPIPGGSAVGPAGAPGQVRPPISTGPIGRGRGDWRPVGVKNGPMQKGFHPGFGVPAWGSNMAGRGFGSGLEFTLPSHKTIFDIDIDSFEEKPWKYPGADMSDYFNFGLNEESWKDYCKQLEQHRLETTMQSKIRVYESGRAEQEYDPDLPPELAAATGLDVKVDSSSLERVDAGQSDLTKGSARVRPPIPTGRPIQVESGYGERLPSIDTRPPRVRDSDAVIEIVLQDSVGDDSSAANGVLDGGNDLPGDDFRGSHVAEDDMKLIENSYFDDHPRVYDSRKGGKRAPSMDSVRDNLSEGDGVLPFHPEAPGQYHPGSRRQPPTFPGGDVGSREERPMQGRLHDKSPHLILGRSTKDRRSVHGMEEVSAESRDSKCSPILSSSNTLEDARDLSVEDKDDAVPDELVVAEVSSGMEKNKMTENEATANDALIDVTKHQTINRKITSHVEQPAIQVFDDREDSKAARSSDNSKGRSGSCKDYQKRHDGIEEEVVQAGRSARRGSVKRHFDENEKNLQRRDREVRQEMERNRVVVKGREDSHPHRDLDPGLANYLLVKHDGCDRGRERENPDGSWHRRDEDTHSKKSRTGDMRKRERGDDMESRHRSKTREIMRGDKDEFLHSRKQLDNGSYRVHYDKDGSSRHREREDSTKTRFEVVDDYHIKRRKDEEHSRREHAEKEVILHGHREHSSRRRREREDVLEPRKREDQQRTRDNLDDYHSVRHKDEVWLQRERGERLREREELLLKREREEVHGTRRSRRRADDKAWIDQALLKDGSKVSDKEYQFKVAIRSSEQQKIRDRFEDEAFSHHKGHDDVHIQGNPPNNEDRRSRQERSSGRVGRPVDTSDNQKVHEKKVKENMKRGKEPEDGDHRDLGPSRRNQDDQGGHTEEMRLKDIDQLESGENEISVKNASRRHKDEASSDDEKEESRRGRSKLERWTSHIERDYTVGNMSSASLMLKERNKNDNGGNSEASKLPDEPPKRVEAVQSQPLGEEKDAGDMDNKDTDTKPLEGRHLDTVEKLKKRSERFKLPMPSDKDHLASKKENGALPSVKTETTTDSEIKPERPARKRRWISN